MLKLYFIFFVTFPALFSYAIAYYIRKPNAADARDALIMAPVFLVLTIVVHYFGYRKNPKIQNPNLRLYFKIARFAGIGAGFALFVMFYFVLL